mmetsp:Transcript_75055/g.142782  ORF Transcript_75055/g.142782 Transcript_75055/m.142782 type:complete len:221 (-) Transcript_75055:32-694(-)
MRPRTQRNLMTSAPTSSSQKGFAASSADSVKLCEDRAGSTPAPLTLEDTCSPANQAALLPLASTPNPAAASALPSSARGTLTKVSALSACVMLKDLWSLAGAALLFTVLSSAEAAMPELSSPCSSPLAPAALPISSPAAAAPVAGGDVSSRAALGGAAHAAVVSVLSPLLTSAGVSLEDRCSLADDGAPFTMPSSPQAQLPELSIPQGATRFLAAAPSST